MRYSWREEFARFAERSSSAAVSCLVGSRGYVAANNVGTEDRSMTGLLRRSTTTTARTETTLLSVNGK